jgi:two-component system, sensor histidine kinase and response regulator
MLALTPAARHADPRQLEGLRVLVVDDNAVNCRILVRCWRTGARSPRSARAGKPFLLVLLDGMMPGMYGSEATHRIREADRAIGHHTPIVAMTAHAMTGDRERCLAAGMDDYLSKPLKKQELFLLLEQISNDRKKAGATAQSHSPNGHQPGEGLQTSSR